MGLLVLQDLKANPDLLDLKCFTGSTGPQGQTGPNGLSTNFIPVTEPTASSSNYTGFLTIDASNLSFANFNYTNDTNSNIIITGLSATNTIPGAIYNVYVNNVSSGKTITIYGNNTNYFEGALVSYTNNIILSSSPNPSIAILTIQITADGTYCVSALSFA